MCSCVVFAHYCPIRENVQVLYPRKCQTVRLGIKSDSFSFFNYYFFNYYFLLHSLNTKIYRFIQRFIQSEIFSLLVSRVPTILLLSKAIETT